MKGRSTELSQSREPRFGAAPRLEPPQRSDFAPSVHSLLGILGLDGHRDLDREPGSLVGLDTTYERRGQPNLSSQWNDGSGEAPSLHWNSKPFVTSSSPTGVCMTHKNLPGLRPIVAMFALVASAASAQQPPNLQGQKVTVANFGGSLQQAIRDGWVEPFEKASGAKVILDSPNAKAKLKAMVDAGNPSWDVYTEDAAYVSEHCGDLFEKVDTSKFVDAGIDKRYVNNACGVPAAIVAYVFTYNEEKYKDNPPKAWADFFDLKSYPGKRAIYNSVLTGILEMALLADGVPVEKLYPLDVDRAFRKLDTIKSSITWTQSTGGLTDALVNNQVDLALSFAGRSYAAAKAGAKVALVKDQQIVTWDQYVVVKGSKNKDAAEAFLQFIAQPAQQAKITELRASANGNLKAQPRVDPLLARFLPVPDKAIPQNQDWWAKNYAAVSQRFVAWQSK